MPHLTVNGRSYDVDADPNTPLLWALREQVGLTGTKYGCGIAQCGACTVHVDGIAIRSCSLPVSEAEGKQITTIEGLARMVSCILFNKLGSSTTCRSVGTAKLA